MQKKVIVKTDEYLESERQWLIKQKRLAADSFYSDRLKRVDNLIYRLGKHKYTLNIAYDDREDLLSHIEEKIYAQHPYTIFDKLNRKER